MIRTKNAYIPPKLKSITGINYGESKWEQTYLDHNFFTPNNKNKTNNIINIYNNRVHQDQETSNGLTQEQVSSVLISWNCRALTELKKKFIEALPPVSVIYLQETWAVGKINVGRWIWTQTNRESRGGGTAIGLPANYTVHKEYHLMDSTLIRALYAGDRILWIASVYIDGSLSSAKTGV